MRSSDFYRRLVRLELAAGGSCRTCRGRDRLRIVTFDEDMTLNGETTPEHCPDCGTPAAQTLEFVGLTLDDLP